MKRTLHLQSLESRLAPALATWDGGGTDNNWSTPANWVGDIAPQPGDDLLFPFTAARSANVNDFAAGTVFRSLDFEGHTYQISGNRIALAASITSNNSQTVISLDIELAAALTITNSYGAAASIIGTIDLNGQTLTVESNGGSPGGGPFPPFPGIITIAGPIRGAGNITQLGTQLLVLSGDSDFTGIVDVVSGSLVVSSNNALGAVGSGNHTMIESGAVLRIGLNGVNTPEPLVFANRAQDNQNPLFAFGTNGMANAGTLSGPITLLGSTRWVGEITIAGGVSGHAGIEMQGQFTFAPGSVSSMTGQIIFDSGSGQFDGQGPSALVLAPTSLASVRGTGSVGPVTAYWLQPGNAGIGTLTTGNLIVGGLFDIDIGSRGADRVMVGGTVALSAALQITPESGFTPPPGTVYRLIDNDGGDPVAGSFANLPQGAVATTINGVPLYIDYKSGDGNDVELTTIAPPVPRPAFSVGIGATGAPAVRVYSADGSLLTTIPAYDNTFRGGIHVVTADITGDGVKDIVTAPASGGGPDVRVFDGVTFALVREFNAYDPSFFGGVFIACADIDADGRDDVITGAGAGGGPHVKVFSGATGAVLSSFLAYDPQFTGGVSVAATDGANVPIAHVHYNGTIITGAGKGGGPHVRTFDGITGVGYGSFFAYDQSFTGGVNVAVGQFGPINTGGPNIVTAPASAGAPDVRVYNPQGQQLAAYFAYSPTFTGGVSVAVQPIGVGGSDAILTGAGGGGGPHIEQWEFPGPVATRSFLAFDPAFLGGVFVG